MLTQILLCAAATSYASAQFLQGDWPPVALPSSFSLEGAYYTYDENTGILSPYQGVTVVQSIDSEGNRQKVVTTQDFGGAYGLSEVINHIDCSKGVLTQRIPKMNYCR